MQRLPRRCWGTPDRLRCVRFPNTDVPNQTPTCLPRANDHAKFPAVKKHSGHSPRVVGLQAPGEKKNIYERHHMFRVLFRERSITSNFWAKTWEYFRDFIAAI